VGGLFDEKTKGQKSRDTVPLRRESDNNQIVDCLKELTTVCNKRRESAVYASAFVSNTAVLLYSILFYKESYIFVKR
jgi:hypothetical protein